MKLLELRDVPTFARLENDCGQVHVFDDCVTVTRLFEGHYLKIVVRKDSVEVYSLTADVKGRSKRIKVPIMGKKRTGVSFTWKLELGS